MREKVGRIRKFKEWLRFWARYLEWKLDMRRYRGAFFWQKTLSELQECNDRDCIFNKLGVCENPLYYDTFQKEFSHKSIMSCSKGIWRYETYEEKRKRRWQELGVGLP